MKRLYNSIKLLFEERYKVKKIKNQLAYIYMPIIGHTINYLQKI
jgi:hypothetical protein